MKERMILLKRVKKAAVSVVLSVVLMSSLVVNSEATMKTTIVGVGITMVTTIIGGVIISIPLVGLGVAAGAAGAVSTKAFLSLGLGVMIGGGVLNSFVSQWDGFNDGYDKGKKVVGGLKSDDRNLIFGKPK
jgi:hypothetical protein